MSLARVVLPERVGHGVLRALLDCHDACRHGCLPAKLSGLLLGAGEGRTPEPLVQGQVQVR